MALVGAAVVGVTALSLAKVNSISLNAMKANSVALQAYQFADAEAQLVRASDYASLASKAKADIPNSNGFQREITLSAESNYSDTVKQKTATVKIYRSGESTPRISLDIKRYSQSVNQSEGVPVGSIIGWVGSNAPTGGTWLLCNGQSCASYPTLRAIVGNNVPNLSSVILPTSTSVPVSVSGGSITLPCYRIGHGQDNCFETSNPNVLFSHGSGFLVGTGSSFSAHTYSTYFYVNGKNFGTYNFPIYGINGIYSQISSYTTIKYYIKAA
ncbi:MAG: phage tail protein [Phascolarctobacterium sp.]